jgi:hypothetical protein
MLLIILAAKTRFDFEIPAQTTEQAKRRWRDIPIARNPRRYDVQTLETE